MNRIVRTALVFTFVVGFSGIYFSKLLSASSCCGGSKEGGHDRSETSSHVAQGGSAEKSEEEKGIKDPVCGMEISDLKMASTEEYKNEAYYFCSEYCKNKFKKDPASYTTVEEHQHGEAEGHKH